MTPIQRIRLSAELRKLSEQLASSELSPLEKVAKSARCLELRKLLGGENAAPAEQAPAVQMPEGEAPMESDPEEDGAPDESELSDDPNSPNYRFRDTGYIPGSRKELAQQIIRRAKESGQQVLATDLDWAALEQNPREAAELIVKSNLFGKVDWAAHKEAGMEPGAGFLIDRVYASIAPKPEDNQQARHDYALALQTIRERLESCLAVDEVRQVLDEVRGELSGVVFNTEEAAQYNALQAQYDELNARYMQLYQERKALEQALSEARAALAGPKREQSTRQRRKWKPDPEIEAEIARLEPAAETARLALVAWDEAHPEFAEKWTTVRTETGVEGRVSGGLRSQLSELRQAMREVERASQARNVRTNPLTRGWLAFGPRFLAVVNFRSERLGSKTFRDHYTSAKNGRVKDWEWAEKEAPAKVPRSTKQEINFRLKVADTFQRVGGTPVKVDSTVALKELVGFRDIQVGKWVAEDPASAAFHVQATAEAMLDLSDMVGIAPGALGLGGRLAMAFGARGRGNAGWGGAAQAHYEPVHRVINLTKMGGGGALGHELFHAIDNMLGELMGGEPGKKDGFASLNPEQLPEGVVREAMRAVRAEMLTGPRRLGELIKLKPRDKRLAQHNIDGYPTMTLPRLILAAGNLDAAVLAVDEYFKGRAGRGAERNRKDWRRLAAAYYSPDGAEVVQAKTGPEVSNFMAEAVILDNGVAGKYWSKPEEMAARAFQSYLEDKMAAAGRRNDYLSVYADNKYHYDAMLGVQWRPYPEGDERQRINAAFDRFFAALREERVFEKAAGNKALLDSIFGMFDEAE